MSKKNKAKLSVLALALVACMAVVGISAYFTDGETVTNEFTVGKVEIDLTEPTWPGKTENVVPGQEIKKDPTVKNTGNNDAYVFVTVEIPTASVKTATAAGVAEETASVKELFEFTKNAGWVELTEKKTTGENSVTHVFAYAADVDNLTKLAANATVTAPVFDAVRMINVTEGSTIEASDKDIVVSAYAIQADHLKNETAIDGTNVDALTSAAEVWDVVVAAKVALD